MKRSIGVAIPLALVLVAFLGFIACTSDTSNQQGKGDALAPSPSPGDSSEECKGLIGDKLRKLKLKYENPNTDTGDAHLNAQRIGNHYNITIEPDAVWGIAMRIKGRVSRDDNPRKLSKLIKYIEKDMEKGCVQRVSFESMTSASGFEWTICEDPNRPCPPNGECGMCMIPKDTPPVNGNSNVNANAPANPNPGNTGTNSTNANTGRNSGP